jgi:hypothetical protein
MKIEWLEPWGEVRRMWSVWVFAAVAFLGAVAEAWPVVWASLPPEAQAIFPDEVTGWAFIIAALVGVVARNIKQPE